MSANKPVIEFKSGRQAKVVIWKNEDHYAVQIQPPQYKDDKGNWKSGNFFETDIPGIIRQLERAQNWLEHQTVPSQDTDIF